MMMMMFSMCLRPENKKKILLFCSDIELKNSFSEKSLLLCQKSEEEKEYFLMEKGILNFLIEKDFSRMIKINVL